MKNRILAVLCRYGLHWNKKLMAFDPLDVHRTSYHYGCDDCGKVWIETTDLGLEVWR